MFWGSKIVNGPVGTSANEYYVGEKRHQQI